MKPGGAHCDRLMTTPPPDGSRDRRIEDPSNLWLIHPLGRWLLPFALRMRVSANMVSVTGLIVGAGAALAFSRFGQPGFAWLGLALAIGWLVLDGLDGMVARATRTSSALGRMLDGLCDHGVFTLIYVAMALRIGTAGGWALAVAAGVAHALQSSLYEGERARFHRRQRGLAVEAAPPQQAGALVRVYDRVAGLPERLGAAFEARLRVAADPRALGGRYAAAAVAPMRLLALQTANMRVLAIFLACLAADPRLFWWFEIAPLSIALVAGLIWHRRVERGFFHSGLPASSGIIVKGHGH